MSHEMSQPKKAISPLTAAIAGFLFPGAGYWVIGQHKRALAAGIPVALLFLMSLLIAGVRVISVPGFSEDGYLLYNETYIYANGERRILTTNAPVISVERSEEEYRGMPSFNLTRRLPDGTLKIQHSNDRPAQTQLLLLANPIGAIGENISFLGQCLNGPLCAAGGVASIKAARQGAPRSYSRAADIGSLYAAVSGMLNLLLIVDAAVRAGHTARKEPTA